MSPAELRTQLATIEHQRWSEWQQYMHGLARPDEHGNLVVSKEIADRWSRQYHTPYAQLSEAEQASDMAQVDRYWPLLAPLIRLAELTRGFIDGWESFGRIEGGGDLRHGLAATYALALREPLAAALRVVDP